MCALCKAPSGGGSPVRVLEDPVHVDDVCDGVVGQHDVQGHVPKLLVVVGEVAEQAAVYIF